MARDNYSYQKYRRELAKKKKKEEKLQKKLDKKTKQPEEPAVGIPGDVEPSPSTPEQLPNGQDNTVE